MMRKNEVGVNDEAAGFVKLVILAFQGGSGIPQQENLRAGDVGLQYK